MNLFLVNTHVDLNFGVMELLWLLGGFFLLYYIINLNLRISKFKAEIYKTQIQYKRQNDAVASLCMNLTLEYGFLYNHIDETLNGGIESVRSSTPFKINKPSKYLKDLNQINNKDAKRNKK